MDCRQIGKLIVVGFGISLINVQQSKAETYSECIQACTRALSACENSADDALRAAQRLYDSQLSDAEENYQRDLRVCRNRYPNDRTLREQCNSGADVDRQRAKDSATAQLRQAKSIHELAKQECRKKNDTCVGKLDPNGDGNDNDATGCQARRFCTAPNTANSVSSTQDIAVSTDPVEECIIAEDKAFEAFIAEN